MSGPTCPHPQCGHSVSGHGERGCFNSFLEHERTKLKSRRLGRRLRTVYPPCHCWYGPKELNDPRAQMVEPHSLRRPWGRPTVGHARLLRLRPHRRAPAMARRNLL